MLKYLKKLAMEIVPSVVATILGAYIVNHYINAKPATPAATVAAVAPTTVDSKNDASKNDAPKVDASKADASASKTTGAKPDAKPAETSVELSSFPGPGIKAKGIAEKSVSEKAAGEKSIEAKPAETANAPAEAPRHVPAREKLIARSTPAEMPAPEEHRDAADLARAAIERLRASEATKPAEKPSDSARAPADPSRIVTAAPPPVSPVRPLPPPITVSTPPADTSVVLGPPPGNPAITGSVQPDGRPTPPADIPLASPLRPLDLRADTESAKDRMHNVAEDMLSAAKSVFHAVIPK